ncbi:hypothetical protein Mgra_00000281 [Meloidogyne graminicola]|uniref:MFS domain-containing protein n=1 Tax=Meloidogyne graminicola TaxID=189291 RepID=A0A8T0A4J1_9BILA|nr:hypothetical protein Mgra_00000281 [Meloidogyne graminicola]
MLLGRILSTDPILLPWGVHLSLYTAPVYFMAFISIIGLIIVLIGFDGRMDKTLKEEEKMSNDLVKQQKWAIKSSIQLEKSPLDLERAKLEVSTDLSLEEPPKIEKSKKLQFNKKAIFACIVARLCMCMLILYLTSLSAPYSMTVFALSGEQMVFITMLIQFSMGVFGIFVCLGYAFRLLSRLDERCCITAALIIMILFFLLTFPWPFINSPMPLPTFINQTLGNSSIQTLITQGCSPEKYNWCLTTPAINIYVYHLSLAFTLGIILPLGNINLDALYSRLLGPIKQGTMQGLFVALSDIVLFVGPIIMTNVYQWGGPRPVWIGIIALFGIGIAFWLYSYEHLVPKYSTVQKINKEKKKHLS